MTSKNTEFLLIILKLFRIFSRLNLNYKVVLADTGAIGGNGSHQFMALSDIGESEIVYCDTCGYAADVEKATSKLEPAELEDSKEMEKVSTPKMRTIEEVSTFLNIDPKKTVKTLYIQL